MTAFEYLQKRARIVYIVPIVPLLPGMIGLAITLLWADPTNAIVQFCSAYWWLMLVTGAFASYATMVIGARLMACPFCDFKLSSAGTGPIQFLGINSKAKFCPNCAAAFSKPVPRRNDT